MFVIKWTSLWTITNLIYCIQKIALFSTEHLGLFARTVTWAQGFINECQPQAGGPDWFVQTARSPCRFISWVPPRHNRHKPINVDQCGGIPWRSFVRGGGGGLAWWCEHYCLCPPVHKWDISLVRYLIDTQKHTSRIHFVGDLLLCR